MTTHDNGAYVKVVAALDQAIASASGVRRVDLDAGGLTPDVTKWPQTGVQLPLAEWTTLVLAIRELASVGE